MFDHNQLRARLDLIIDSFERNWVRLQTVLNRSGSNQRRVRAHDSRIKNQGVPEKCLCTDRSRTKVTICPDVCAFFRAFKITYVKYLWAHVQTFLRSIIRKIVIAKTKIVKLNLSRVHVQASMDLKVPMT